MNRFKLFSKAYQIGFLTFLLVSAQAANTSAPFILNNPYPADDSSKKIYYTSLTEPPKTLDIAKSYSSNEILILSQIYEPPLQYDYLARPYQLKPLTLREMPRVRYYDAEGRLVLDPTQSGVARSVYTLYLKPGIYYQPHPAFARTRALMEAENIKTLHDFKQVGTRELTADDYIYQIKRLANPTLSSPIYGLMSQHILGFREFYRQLPKGKQYFVDLRHYPLTGLKKIDRYSFEITLIGQFEQFKFWLAMPFFAPIPWEVDWFYAQPNMKRKNWNLGWYPVGTGPFMMTENNPNYHIVLEKNPNYHADYFPVQGRQSDVQKGYLRYHGQRVPMIDQVIFTLEKESIPRWSKFLQGYYDISGISADSFDQAIQLSPRGKTILSHALCKQGMRLEMEPELTIYYLGFNMFDPVVGGYSERARKLRQAISIALDYDEYITIFLNRRGQIAQGPIPPGIFGYRSDSSGMNPYVFRRKGAAVRRRSFAEAQALMREAGYPKGMNPKTGRALILHYDVAVAGGPEDKAEMDWMRKQFARLGIELDVRATQYNRFQDKLREGNTQIFKFGWSADYPDPENFLFLFQTTAGKVKYGGENTANYSNPFYDALYQEMKNRPNDQKRLELIDKMVEILRHDAPWVWGFHSELFTLSQAWVAPIKPIAISSATYKYIVIDRPWRERLRKVWNQPIIWPLLLFLGINFAVMLPYYWVYRKKRRAYARRYGI